MKVYIIAMKGKSLSSKFIRFYQFGFPYTHIAYLHSDNKLTEAWHLPLLNGGSVYYKVSITQNHQKGTLFTVYSVNVSQTQLDSIEEFLKEQEGRKYDWFGLLGFALRKDYTNVKSKWFCSELIFQAFKQAKIDLLKNVNAWQVSPRDLLTSPLLEKEYDDIVL